jgi:hypothetical protein
MGGATGDWENNDNTITPILPTTDNQITTRQGNRGGSNKGLMRGALAVDAVDDVVIGRADLRVRDWS